MKSNLRSLNSYWLLSLIILFSHCAESNEVVSDNDSIQSGWIKHQFGSFSIETPQGWKKNDRKSIDSFIGAIGQDSHTISFCYGSGCPSIDNEEIDKTKHLFATDTVSGLNATIVIPVEQGHGSIIMTLGHFSKTTDRFIISIRNYPTTDTILKIFKSIRFNEIDNHKTSLTKEWNFKPMTGFASGQELFEKNCVSCHDINTLLVGPPLKGIRTKRDSEWIYKFLTNPESLKNDRMYKHLTEKYPGSCMKFKSLTRSEVAAIIDFCETGSF